ncbi:MAG: hypothetical protein HWN66_03820 [Candidatus Helarchaeota archaeon]|nr:hypothetical protein [Candidatus Helarchaeota archaeon]
MIEITLNLKDTSIEILEKFAIEQNLSKEELCEMILDTWSAFGGQIWSGDYKDTRAFIIDWPVRRDLIKIGNK